jgi:phosphotransferase system HPr-like phosphotransfer protein
MLTAVTTPPSEHISARVESLLSALSETRRQLAGLHAREAALLAEAVDLAQAQSHVGDRVETRSAARDIPLRSLAAQIGAVLRVSDRTTQRQLSDAAILATRFPATLAALADGQIARPHVQIIVEAGLPIQDDAARAAYEATALDIARRETPGRLRPAARLLAAKLHPTSLEDRHRAAAADRDVWVRDLEDGMAELVATLPAPIAHGILDRLNRYARAVVDTRASGAGDTARGDDASSSADSPDRRRIGEIRGDVFADLLLTGHASPEVSNEAIPEAAAIVAQVQITVPALTVLGADSTPAELVGHAPIDTATALRLAAGAPGWDRVLTHPVTGSVLAVDRYRPSDQLRRALRVRDEHCRFPGCRIPTRSCDLDHTTARQHDGPTELANLAHLCRRHHTLKHHSAWRVRQTPDGILQWTSPTGRTHPDRPARTLVFTSAEHDPPPF